MSYKEKHFPTKHNMSEKMIIESKNSVLETLTKYLNSTEDELKDFTLLIENEDIENWTCSFEELEDMFLKMKNNKEFENNAPEHEPDYIDFINKEGKYTPIECSLELDYEFQNQSE